MRGMEYYLDAMENGPQLSGIFMEMRKLVKRFSFYHNNSVTNAFIYSNFFIYPKAFYLFHPTSQLLENLKLP